MKPIKHRWEKEGGKKEKCKYNEEGKLVQYMETYLDYRLKSTM
jgi:hypothetical protein